MPKHPDSNAIGQHYEALALQFLQDKGLKLLESNFHCRLGEIDLIMQDDQTLCFIEVRFRRQKKFGSAMESITRPKQQRILKTAAFYLSSHVKHQQDFCRFDVIAIELDSSQQAQYHWLKAAFTE
ncbi:MAG: YraN family protein [Pseudomonadales bacterium]|nr:YraN family protein [Pseudomonadales bacterium]